MMDKRSVMDTGISQVSGGEHALDRMHTTRLAHQLSVVALRQSEKAITGMLALPVATALGAAAGVMYVAAFFERGFEIFETSVAEIGRQVSRDVDPARMDTPWTRDADRSSEARS